MTTARCRRGCCQRNGRVGRLGGGAGAAEPSEAAVLSRGASRPSEPCALMRLTTRPEWSDHRLMADKLVLLVVGFTLTSIVGGFLGYQLQRRAWREQERARQLQSELDAAKTFFEELSRVFDRRLHRMRELDSWCSRPGESDEVERSLRPLPRNRRRMERQPESDSTRKGRPISSGCRHCVGARVARENSAAIPHPQARGSWSSR